MKRVITYIDGFNLYFGLKSKGWRQYYWLNIQKLAENLLKPSQELVFTKYFTARISEPISKQNRQAVYIRALETLTNFEIFYGHYQLNPQKCRNCGFTTSVPNEKMTDVNIAVEILSDAFQDKFDTAILISADSDLTASVASVRRLFPNKRVVVAFPPKRYSVQLIRVASAHFIIGRANFARSLFPQEIIKPDGFVLKCPESWK